MSDLQQEILDAEKMVAVTLRREFSDLLPSTDAWRPIAQRACQLIAQRLAFDSEFPVSGFPEQGDAEHG